MNISKALAVLAAVSLVSCGSSAKENSSASAKEETKTLAEQLTENLENGKYAIDMVIVDESGTEMPCKMSAKDGNGYVSMTTDGVLSEFYTVDSKTYLLLPDINCFQITEQTNNFGNILFVIGEGDTLSKSETKNGETTEIYTSDNSGEKETYTFVFDEESGDLKNFKSVTAEGTRTITVNSISFNGTDIKLPDISGWSDFSDLSALDKQTQIKLSLYFMGVTEEDVEKAGYTLKQLSEMTDEELAAALLELGADIFG